MDKEKAKSLYSTEDQKRFLDMLAKMPGVGNTISNLQERPSMKTNTDKFIESLRFPTKTDEKRLDAPLPTKKSTTAEEANSSLQYVPIRYTETPGFDENEKYAYLIRFGRDNKNKIYGMETADGRSFTSEGTKKFLEALRDRGGKIELLEQNPRKSVNTDIRKDTGIDGTKRGFLEALLMTNPMGREGLRYTGGMGANSYYGRG